MKNKILILVRVFLKSGTGLDLKAGRKKLSPQLLLMIFVGICFLPMAVSIAYLVSAMFDSLAQIGQEGIVLSLGTGVTAFIIFFFGIFYILNTFYFSSDVECLLPLPLKPWQIIGAKFLVTVIYEYLTEILFMGPLIIVYGVKSGGGILFYLYSIIVILLLPVIPLVISSIIVMIVMGFTSIGKNRDRLKLVGGIVAMFIGIGGNIVIQRFFQSSVDQENLIRMLTEGKNSLLGITSNIFPGSYFAALGLVESRGLEGIINILIFVAINIVGFLVFMYLGKLLYFRGVVGISETRAKRKRITSEDFNKATVRNTSMKSYIIKEIKILVRTPIYFLNCVLINFLWPLFLVIPFFAQSGGVNEMESLFSLVKTANQSIIFAIGFGFSIFAASSNGIAASSISREGRNVFVTKYLPISYMTQITAKALSGVLISISGLISMMLVLTFLLEIPLVIAIFIVVASAVGIVFISYVGIMIDLINPKLNWDNEQKAVKQNINIIFSLLVGIVFAGAFVWGIIASKLSLVPAFLITTGMSGLLSVGMYQLLQKRGVALFEKINA